MVYTIGETVLDIIVQNFDNVKIRVGGSMLNSAVSLGRLGIPVEHISYVSDDQIADSIFEFLVQNRVSSNRVTRMSSLKTNLALAFLDIEKKANYSFYKNKDTDQVKFTFPKVNKEDIILFGSFFSLNENFRGQLVKFLSYAKEIGAFIIYDPNFRAAHLDNLPKVLPYINENIALADMVKGSDEDFNLIFGTSSVQSSWNVVKEIGAEHLVYTKGRDGAMFVNETLKCTVDSLDINPISTIGAGDTFTAGIVYGLFNGFNKLKDKSAMHNILSQSHEFSAHVCMSYDNYLSNEFIKELENV